MPQANSKDKTKELTVYLDHLIKRENLRYQRRYQGGLVRSQQKNPWLGLKELLPETLRSSNLVQLQLRKPDFQRATLSWTPEDCALLLESFVNGMVVPSIVMWTNPASSYHYILDGAHRVSVAMAWLADDWGDKKAPSAAKSSKQADRYIDAAKAVRALVNQRIGHVSDFRADYEEFQRLEERDEDPHSMGTRQLNRALFYKNYIAGQVGFPVVWVEGDYNIAEQSFLRINKSGKSLSEWETRVIEYRNSSAMRVIMSVVATSESAEHYWPKASIQDSYRVELSPMVDQIHEGVEVLRRTLLTPVSDRPFKPEPQPLMWTSNQAEIPRYLGELLCVLDGNRGLETEIVAMLSLDRQAETEAVVQNGAKLLSDTLAHLSHFVGGVALPNRRQQNQNKSLGIVPIVYCYTQRGDYVRSLLYGFVYWMLSGDQDDVIKRKRAFCCHREGFEYLLLHRKSDPLGLVRKTGSGAEITVQTAQYFDGLLQTLARHHGEVTSKEFSREYGAMVRNLVGRPASGDDRKESQPAPDARRAFTPKQKRGLAYETYVSSLPRCGICRGYINLADDVQHDHITDYAQGGQTDAANQQVVHPFCNNPDTKQQVLAARAGMLNVAVPALRTRQL